jgi:hypothetical protein
MSNSKRSYVTALRALSSVTIRQLVEVVRRQIILERVAQTSHINVELPLNRSLNCLEMIYEIRNKIR